MRRQSVDHQTNQNRTNPTHLRRGNSTKSFQSRQDDEENVKESSPATRGNQISFTDFDKTTIPMDNRAARLRTAHLHWLIDNKVYTNDNMEDYQNDIRGHRPSNSVRYPIRIPHRKTPTDPEWVSSDYRVHIYHSSKDKLWVKQWFLGIFEAKRFQVTTNYEPCWDCDRVIVILSQHFLRTVDLINEAHDGMQGRVSMVIKKEECLDSNNFTDKCQVLLDLSNLDMQDYSFQSKLMSWLLKSLSLPESICSA